MSVCPSCRPLVLDSLLLSAAISAFAVAAMVLPGNYPAYLDLLGSLSVGPALIGMAKLAIAFPASYHTYNGIRHLVRKDGFLSGCVEVSCDYKT